MKRNLVCENEIEIYYDRNLILFAFAARTGRHYATSPVLDHRSILLYRKELQWLDEFYPCGMGIKERSLSAAVSALKNLLSLESGTQSALS